jgi:hypothetical protein
MPARASRGVCAPLSRGRAWLNVWWPSLRWQWRRTFIALLARGRCVLVGALLVLS